MIEIIKPGQTKFTATCSQCGCEFTYELEDVVGKVVVCPCCGNHITHARAIENINYPYGAIPYSELTNILSKNSCEDCDFYKKYLAKGGTYIGDAPCQWCQNYMYRITCYSSVSTTRNK